MAVESSQAASPPATPLWELRNITKTFPGVVANDGVSLTLTAGRVHGLLGENGCGKSTLIKILSGVQSPDSGEILHKGKAIALSSPSAASAAGVATVYQEFSLIPEASVAENIFMGRHPLRFGGFVDWARIDREAEKILSELALDIDVHAKVGSLSVAEQQLVEVAKALAQDAELLILDEPTTALGKEEVETLLDFLRRMAGRGVAILYISHRLDEVVALVDDFTIMKDGRVVSSPGQTPKDVESIVSTMIGTALEDQFPKEDNATEEVVLEARGLRTRHRVRDASFTLRRGEVLGLGGVIGAGRTEIARAVFGVDRLLSGEIIVDGRPLRMRNPTDAIRAGIALVPENRKSEGLFFNFAAGPNITAANIAGVAPGLLFSHRRERQVTQDYIAQLDITKSAATKAVNLISGGNQQKVLIARWLFRDAQVVIFDEPTQGIDVGARLAVYRLINRLTKAGKSVILISSAHDELLGMSDRVALVHHGVITDVRPVADVSPADLVSASETEHVSDRTESDPL